MIRPGEVSQPRIREFLREARDRPAVPDVAPTTVAIVSACYRHADYLPAMLASVASQTRLPDQVVFVDDRGEDGSVEILRSFLDAQRWLAGGKGLLLVNDRNLGQAESLNRAIAAATTELVMVLNDDDYLMHDAVASMLGYFTAHPELALVGGHSIHVAGAGELAKAGKLSTDYVPRPQPLTIQTPADVLRYRAANDLNMTHSSSCFRKLAWQAAGGYRPADRRVVPFSDRDFQIRVNALFPVGVAYQTPYALWRTDSSVDVGRNS
jgi:GT2 family glycosyltransferase